MELKTFEVKNYRSITESNKINVQNKTILLGRNNEGKSNLLKALNLAMIIISGGYLSNRRRRRSFPRNFYDTSRGSYDWERDFPVQYQDRKQGLSTILRLKFKLNESEVEDFKKHFNSVLNGELELKITIDRSNRSNTEIIKQGKSSNRLNKQTRNIRDFISRRLKFIYIPAIRTELDAIEVVREILHDELEEFDYDEEYQQAVEIIEKQQKKILNKISNNIMGPLKEFIPSIENVKINIEERRRSYALMEGIDVIIDDGIETSLEAKGDGIKSLAALALIKDSQDDFTDTIVAVEEPESHLHPQGIHQLIRVLNSISEKNQILISTHSPLFVNTATLKSNILVNEGKARIAKSIKSIRNTLGVKISDNLLHASLVILVEGQTDEKIVNKIISNSSQKIKKALNNNHMRILRTDGAGKLNYYINLLDNSICDYFVFFDNDESGKNAIQDAMEKKYLDESDYMLINCEGMKSSTIEDTIDKEHTIRFMKNVYNIDISKINLKNKNWASYVKEAFEKMGKMWNEEKSAEVKKEFANYISSLETSEILCLHKGNIFEQLIESVENKLAQKQSDYSY